MEIKDGAQALINGVYSVLNGYEVVIEGSGPDGSGAIYGNLDAGYYQTPFIQGLSLSSNATINVVAEDAFNLNNNKGTAYVALNGYELTLADTGRIILWSVNVTNEGSIVASIDPGSSATNICVYTMGNGLSAPLVDFTVPSGKAVGGEAAYVVSNMTFGGVWSGKSGASVTVLGCYKPTSTATSYPPTTLGDATHLNPVLDLSDLSAVYDGSGLSFVDNATVTIKFGERSVQCGTKIVDWTDNAPSNLLGLTFVWGEENRQYFVVKKSDGLYIHHGFVLLVR